MNTPIADFVRAYRESGMARLHMPGHKGQAFLGCEGWDITEISGADSLYEADGIIAESERNASALFGSGRTVYSAEGSSQCIKAMLQLALWCREPGQSATVVAPRNVHKAFLYGAALLDLDVVWLNAEADGSLCSCPVSPKALADTLASLPAVPMAVFVTSPDYLGGVADISALAEVAHRFGTRLLVDNAHGAYLHFLPKPCHPLDLGADLCCDSAHKTLPVLTGGAYLHAGKALPKVWQDRMKSAMIPFGSTSPSYLILASLDLGNAYLEKFSTKLYNSVEKIQNIREELQQRGFVVLPSDPLRITVCAPLGCSGTELADRLRRAGLECEYADPEYLVLMLTPKNDPADLEKLPEALGYGDGTRRIPPEIHAGNQVCSIRQALMHPSRRVPAKDSLGKICASPTVACPPAVPIVVSGQEITAEALALFAHYAVETVEIL